MTSSKLGSRRTTQLHRNQFWCGCGGQRCAHILKIIFIVTYLKNSSSSLEVVMAEDEVEMLFSLEDILLINYQIL